ncbi:MAG: hypothetical protein M8364_13155 [Methylobacter sp.]|uniref:SEL1-like repeat protein n=1 Tax=Methylobacter sp. TaxID=2051955 RepID=UPI002589B173|nr:hypothetical protein [Methylobacter sp.]MCL7421844.1 hypothetical protein [Methylobacter sp.]
MTENNKFSISKLQQKANDGDAQAQFELALCYANGTDVEKNTELAFDWHKKAAEQGHVDAQFALGLYYLLGKDQAQRIQELVNLINKWIYGQASGENVDPAFDLAIGQAMTINLSGANDDSAFAWLKKAAEQNHAEANYWLGQCYQNGIGVEQNEGLAFGCFRIAAEQGLAESQYSLACCYFEGKEIEQSDELGMQWCEKAAEQGIASAQYRLAQCYFDGGCVEKNNELALNWLKKSAKNYYAKAEAQFCLADCYAQGVGVEKSDEQAYAWYTKAADKGHAESQYWLARYYLSGGIIEQLGETDRKILETHQPTEYWRNIYLEKGYELAFNWAEKAVENGYREAYLLLGFMSAYGIGTAQDNRQACEFFKKATEHDQQGIADYFLADYYTTEILPPGNENLADFHSKRAHPENIQQYYDIEGLLKNADEKIKIRLLPLSIDLHIACKNFDLARNLSHNLGTVASKYIDTAEQKDKLHKELQQKEKEMLSFFTHTMRNALATAPEALRQAIQLLGSEVYEKDNNHYKAINKIASLFSSLSLTDCLIDTFKQSISDPEEFKQAWENDHSGEASPKWVLASALRQSLNRIIFMSDTSDFRKLLGQPEAASIKAMRKSFIDEVLPLNVDAQGIDKFYQWVNEHIAYLEINLSDIDQIRFGANQTRFSLLFAIASELILNALRYWDGSHTIQIRWQLIASERYVLSVKNHCQPNAISRLAGTHKGLAFIKRLIELLGEQAQFSCNVEDQFFNAELSLNKTLFDEAS